MAAVQDSPRLALSHSPEPPSSHDHDHDDRLPRQHGRRLSRQRRLAPRPIVSPILTGSSIVQSLPQHLAPRSPPDWAPWAPKLTAVQDFYLNNIPDFSGISMCNTKLLTCNLKDLIKIDAAVLTIFVLYGETCGSASGLNVSVDVIYQLKSYLYQIIRHRLRTNIAEDIPILELIIQIRCLASYEASTNPDPAVALLHMRGIKQLLDSYRGERTDDHYIKSKAALLWMDRALAHLHDRPTHVFEPPENAFWNPASPLLLGTLPPPDRLPDRQTWIRLLVSAHMAPGNEILIYIHTILANWPAADAAEAPLAQTVRCKAVLEAVQARLVAKTPESQSAILIYRDERFELQRDGCEALRRTGLVLVNVALMQLMEPDATLDSVRQSPHVDHTVQVMLGLNLAAIVCQCPEIVFWCLSVVGPLVPDGPVGRSLALLFQQVTKQLKLKTFKMVLSKLAGLFAVPFIHTEGLPPFWERAMNLRPRRVVPVDDAIGEMTVEFDDSEE